MVDFSQFLFQDGVWTVGSRPETLPQRTASSSSSSRAAITPGLNSSIALTTLREDYDNAVAHTVARELLAVLGQRRGRQEAEAGGDRENRKRSITSVIKNNQANSTKSKELTRSFIGKVQIRLTSA